MLPESPLRHDGETINCCAVCGTPFHAVGRQRFCTPACRQSAWRRRHATPPPALPPRAPRPNTVYPCSSCDSRALGEQYCSDCGTFRRRVGPGGLCPSCEEPIALADLLPTLTPSEVTIRH
jgi:hypothetical protein